MEKDLVKTVVFDLTLEIARLKEELEHARSLERLWFTNYTKKENELNAIKGATTACATDTQAECFENMA